MDLSHRHVAASLTATPSVFTARRTIVLPAKRPEFRGDSAHTCARLVSSFLAASDIAAATLLRIWRLIHPCEFCANGIDTDESMGMI